MNYSILISGVCVLFIFLLIRRLKKGNQKSANRYRPQTKIKKQEATVKVSRNRYHTKQKAAPTVPEIKLEEPKKHVETPKTEAPKKVKKATPSHDPDIVLGLKKPIPTDAQITLKPPPPPAPIMAFHIVSSNEKPYNGYELLQAILSVGMRYGKHKIFHRHEETTGRGAILFSLSSITKPGTFDLPNMGNFSTPGLSLFFSADACEDPIAVYELMLQTAGQLVEDLGGRVLDEKRQVLTPKTVVLHRQQLNAYIHAQQVPDLFESIEE